MTGVMSPVNAELSPIGIAFLGMDFLNNTDYEPTSVADVDRPERLTQESEMLISVSGQYKLVPVQDSAQKKIAVFDFELVDQSAGGGIFAKDAIDVENLKLSTQMARSMPKDSGRYSIIDTSSTIDEIASAGGIQHCNQCEAQIAKRLGAFHCQAGCAGAETESKPNPVPRRIRTQQQTLGRCDAG
jgi:hypothetical protein